MKRACLICTGFVAFHFCTISAQAASPELSKNIVPIAYRIVLTPDMTTARFAGTEEIDVEVKQPTETEIVNAADRVIHRAQLADDSKSRETISVTQKAEPAT